MPPLTWFRAFEAAARNLSFTGAAGELGLTQSAVSQHVRSLELRFGVVLFERKPRGLALTDEGRRLLPDVSMALNTLADLSRGYDHQPEGPSLTIATSVSIGQWYLTPGIADFRRANPDISIRIVNTTWPDEFHLPLADVEIRFGSERLVGKGAARLEPDRSVVVAAPGLSVDPENLAAHPLIAPVGTSDVWRHWAESVGYRKPVEPSLMVDSHGMAVDLACRGAGVALTSSLIAAPALAGGSLLRVAAPSTPSIDGYYLAANSNAGPAAQAFCGWLKSRIADLQEAMV